jgi:hypothetical protein
MARAETVKLGPARCPLCGGKAKAGLSSKGFAYLVMDCCNAQLFSRSVQSDGLVRDLIRQETPVEPSKAPEATNPSTPAPAPAVRAAAPAPATVAPIPKPAPARVGLFPSWTTK